MIIYVSFQYAYYNMYKYITPLYIIKPQILSPGFFLINRVDALRCIGTYYIQIKVTLMHMVCI